MEVFGDESIGQPAPILVGLGLGLRERVVVLLPESGSMKGDRIFEVP